MAGPLLEAIERGQRCVLLIDEIDKGDYAFEAQALKRACACFGLGRYFYRFAEMWVDLNENKQPKNVPSFTSLGASDEASAAAECNRDAGPAAKILLGCCKGSS
jgi:hypothetical protein